jgi:hypothetical protein
VARSQEEVRSEVEKVVVFWSRMAALGRGISGDGSGLRRRRGT